MRIKGENVIEIYPWFYWLELKVRKEEGSSTTLKNVDIICINTRQIQHVSFQRAERKIVISMNNSQKFEFIENTDASFTNIQKRLNQTIQK